jgi:hypothetical protein
MAKEDAAWTDPSTLIPHNCGYGTSTTASNYIKAGTVLYHAGKSVLDVDIESEGHWTWVHFSTCYARVAKFKRTIHTYALTQNLKATYAGPRGGEDYAKDFFKDESNIAYFSNKECEVVIRSTYVDQYVAAASPGVLGSIWYYLTCCCRR